MMEREGGVLGRREDNSLYMSNFCLSEAFGGATLPISPVFPENYGYSNCIDTLSNTHSLPQPYQDQ
jgi:hypothetical protein